MNSAAQKTDLVIHDFQDGLAGVRSPSADVKLSVGHDSAHGDEPVLIVDYPAPTDDRAGRDVRCTAVNRDWTAGRGVSFQVKPTHPVKLSVSFIDRNHVAYTTWTELKGDVWQTVQIAFAEIRPNPYFQPPDAKTGAPLDVSDVMAIAFAPQDPGSGRLIVGTFTVMK